MVYKCCVTNCRGNYPRGPKVHAFQFPADAGLKQKWISVIPRKNFVPTNYSRVCHLHFNESDIVWETKYYDEQGGKLLTSPLSRPRLKEGAIPKIFPGCPSYLSVPSTSRESPQERRERLQTEAMQTGISNSLESYQQYSDKHYFHNFLEFKACYKKHQISSFWNVIEKDHSVMFINLDDPPQLNWILVVNEQLEVTLFNKQTKVMKLDSEFEFPMSISDINTVQNILSYIEKYNGVTSQTITDLCKCIMKLLDTLETVVEEEQKSVIKFLSSQIDLICKSKQKFRYNPQMMIFASLFYLMSPKGYRFVRHSGNLILPHPTTIGRVCSEYNTNPHLEQMDGNFLKYIKLRAPTLELKESYVSLMLDEIHIKPFMDYKGGNLVGTAFESENIASSVHAFMIQGLLSNFTEVVHLLPVNALTSDVLHQIIRKIILGLEGLGFKVINVVTDNNSINRKAMSSFSKIPTLSFVYPHPAHNTRPLFYLTDTVHVFKSIRNNWINQKNSGNSFTYPDFHKPSQQMHTASFSSLRHLYDLECDKFVKHGYGLTLKSLWPSNLERQNVKLVMNIFNKFVSTSLLELGPKHQIHNYSGTANFIDIICTWWDIVNVKSPFKGKRLNNVMQEPLTNVSTDPQNTFLQYFLNWLECWEKCALITGKLTRETHSALKLTTTAFLELSEYCITELKFKYILPGKFQTDALESRFGQYRQMSGAQYHVSLRQVYEVEKKLRLSNWISKSLYTDLTGNITINDCDDMDDRSSGKVLQNSFVISISESDINSVEPDFPVIAYIAGFCSHSVMKKLDCESCKHNLVEDREIDSSVAYNLINSLNRGGLKYPSDIVFNAVIYNYVILKLLVSQHEHAFLSSSNPRSILTELTLNELISRETLGNWQHCRNNHDAENVLKKIVLVSCNVLLKNYCRKKNDQLSKEAKGNKRKLQTLTC